MKALVANNIGDVRHVVQSSQFTSITGIKLCCGPSCDSDHFLLKVTLREILSNALKSQGKKRKRWKIDKLKNEKHLNL